MYKKNVIGYNANRIIIITATTHSKSKQIYSD